MLQRQLWPAAAVERELLHRKKVKKMKKRRKVKKPKTEKINGVEVELLNIIKEKDQFRPKLVMNSEGLIVPVAVGAIGAPVQAIGILPIKKKRKLQPKTGKIYLNLKKNTTRIWKILLKKMKH